MRHYTKQKALSRSHSQHPEGGPIVWSGHWGIGERTAVWEGRLSSHDLPPKVSPHLRSEMGWNSPATVQLICRAGDPGFLCLSGTWDYL